MDDSLYRRSEKPPGFWIGNVFYSDHLANQVLDNYCDGDDHEVE